MDEPLRFDGPRPARPDEREALRRTADLVHRVSKGRDSSVADDFPHVYDPANTGNLLVVAHDRKIVCCVAVWVNDVELGPVRLRVGGINCLATLPEYRRHGLGKTIMEASQRHLRDLGCHVGLLGTRITTWYRNLGWERAGVARTYRIDNANLGLLPVLPNGVALRRGGAEKLDEILRIRQSEHLGGVRDAATFRKIWTGRGRPAVVLAKQSGRAAAYLLARDRSVLEWGGPGAIVAGLLRAWHESTRRTGASASARDTDCLANEELLTVPAPATGHDLVTLLDSRRIPYHTDYVGMLYLLDPAGILRAFGHSKIEVVEQDDLFVLRRGAKPVTVSRAELTKLLFGPERVSDFAESVFPLPFWQWPIEHV